MSQALYRKWRSRTFADLVGQPHVVRTLENALRSDRVAHAYLFNGPRGTGKTSTARLLAKALNCLGADGARPCGECAVCQAIEEARYLDLIEIDAASNNGVEDIRELRNAVNFSPTEGDCKIYIVDEVHMLSPSAFNALLKTLEEPPDPVYFILATTEIHRIPATVISRCQRFDFRRIATAEIQDHLAQIATAEGCDVETAALAMIADSAQGCMRDAISLLDQVVGLGQGTVTLQQVQDLLGLTDIQALHAFVDAIVARDKAKGLAILQDVVFQGGSMAEFLQQVIMQLRAAFRCKLMGQEAIIGDVPPEQAAVLHTWADASSEIQLLHAMTVMVDAAAALKQAPHPQILVELALVAAINDPSETAVAPAETGSRSRPATRPVPAARSAAAAPRPQADPPDRASPAAAPRRPTPQDDQDKKDLRRHWKDLQRTVKNRARNPKAYDALTSGGMSGLEVRNGTVTVFLRDTGYRAALAPEREKMARKLSDYLGRDVKLDLRVVQDAPAARPARARSSSAAPEATVPQRDVDTYLRKQVGAFPMEEREQQELLAQLEDAKDS